MPQALKILIVEDDAIIAQLLEHHLREFGHCVIDIIHNGNRALDRIYSQHPDLVCLDINLEGTVDGIDIAQVIDKKHKIPYLFITALSDESTIIRAQKVNPLAYLVKPFRGEDLRTSIAIGMSMYNRRKHNNPLSLERVNEDALSPLSDKEFEILLEISKGLSNKQIGMKLGLSPNTIKWHSQNIFSKLGVQNRTSAAQLLLAI